MLSWFQSKLIFPSQSTQGLRISRFTPPRGASLVTLPTVGGARVAALFGTALRPDGQPLTDPASCPTLLYFYGNGMCLAYCLDLFENFRRLGANVFIPDYLGYGLSEGEASEEGCYTSADASLKFLRSRPDIDMDQLVVAGWSLGGAVAIDLASREPMAGLASFSSFTAMEDLVSGLMPWVPAGLLLRHRFESERKIARVHCPILIGHSRGDEIIPFAMSDRLARAAGGDVVKLTIEAAPHNDFFDVGGTQVMEALANLFSRAGRMIPPAAVKSAS